MFGSYSSLLLSGAPVFLVISFVYLLLFCCILATEDDDHMVLLLSADCNFFPPNSYLASQKFTL